MALSRASGILLHPTSLPDGRLGAGAHDFVDWLAAAGQSWWQILPVGPPDESGSPYRAGSAFAGWSGLLAEPDAPVSTQELEEFVAAHPYWIGDWAAYAGGDAIADQVRFAREWRSLRDYAAERDVRLIGDLPIYVAPGGADHLAHPELFQPGVVAGVPPDDWSATGQLWGNPIYDWEAMRANGYRWWIERFRRTFELVDLPRIVLQFAFSEGMRNPQQATAVRRNSVMYTGTHDNPTTAQWWAEASDSERANAQKAFRAAGVASTEPHWAMNHLALRSTSNLAILPAQDILGLGAEARMNTPGREAGNWSWRLAPGQLTDELATQLKNLTARTNRLPKSRR